MNFRDLFEKATDHDPFPYQIRLAEGDAWPAVIGVPTGLGKTAATILGWVWRRRFGEEKTRRQTPRRLVYCLPMRVLVEQTERCAVEWLSKLSLLGGKVDAKARAYDPWAGDDDPAKIRVHMLMGGDVDRDWDRYPERDTIIIGTQDMLLSRALNRGYAMSRFRWPMQFGLLNNDCLWVMDEVQLMGSGLATTTQLQAFRRKLGTMSGVQSTWMSATLRREWLATVDFDAGRDAPGEPLEISDADKKHRVLQPRFAATKKLERAPFEATDDGEAEASLALSRHAPGSRTLVVVNTVKRAQSIYAALRKKKHVPNVVLVHSRFRPGDRKSALDKLLGEPGEVGTIGVCTQVVEAGVDVSAKLLITDLAPWAALVQRFGRCNRTGEYNDSQSASVVWIEHASLRDDKKLKAAPYSVEELREAADRLVKLTDVGPQSLPAVTEPMEFTHVIRRKDLIDLFDTTPDLAGADIDISRFIRDTDDHDVRVFWRDVPDREEPSPDEASPAREELCAVPIGEIRGAKRGMWRWDHLGKQWAKVRPDAVFPGLMLMLRACEGGYSDEIGWTAKEKTTEPVCHPGRENEDNDSDHFSEQREWATIPEHTNGVVSAVRGLLDSLKPDLDRWRSTLLTAARWHDGGKAHPIFQGAMPAGAPRADVWAKSKPKMRRYQRPGFRHELSSAIAMLLNGHDDLAAYLTAAHHGKVRLSIRSLPHEKQPKDDFQRRFARGIWDGDVLPATDLGGGVTLPETALDLSFMELGDGPRGKSWLARMLSLRDDPEHGPFRLAYLEALLRVADWRASGDPSADADEEVQP